MLLCLFLVAITQELLLCYGSLIPLSCYISSTYCGAEVCVCYYPKISKGGTHYLSTSMFGIVPSDACLYVYMCYTVGECIGSEELL
jgi:hypothetical protein